MTVVLRRILDRPVGTERPTVHIVMVGSVTVRVVHHHAVNAEAVEHILDGEQRRSGSPALGVAALLPDLFVADAPGWDVGVAVAHRSWAAPLASLSVRGEHTFASASTPTMTEADVVGSWCVSRAVEHLARAAGTTPQHVEVIPVGDGLIIGIAVGRIHAFAALVGA